MALVGLSGLEHLCSVCHRIPKLEIYQCDNGDIYCDECILKMINMKVPKCGLCDAPFPKGKCVRNKFMEKFLDSETFECQYAKEGCKETLRRALIQEHMNSCKFGVTLDICKLLGHDCEFKLTIGNEILAANHLRQQHHCTFLTEPVERKTNFSLILKDFFKFEEESLNAKKPGNVTATWYFLITTPTPDSQTFAVVCKVNGRDSTAMASWGCVNLNLGSERQTPATQDRWNISLVKALTKGLPLTQLKWNLPIVSGLDTGLMMDVLPFQIKISYLKDLCHHGNLQMIMQLGKAEAERVCNVLSPNITYRQEKRSKKEEPAAFPVNSVNCMRNFAYIVFLFFVVIVIGIGTIAKMFI